MRGVLSVIGALLFSAAAAKAQVVSECGTLADVTAIVEPWDENTRTFANGDVRLAVLDFGLPEGGTRHLLVLSPPLGQDDQRQCHIVSRTEDAGWAVLDIAAMSADYDQQAGLVFGLPGRIYLPAEEFTNAVELSITVSQLSGAVGVSQGLGRD